MYRAELEKLDKQLAGGQEPDIGARLDDASTLIDEAFNTLAVSFAVADLHSPRERERGPLLTGLQMRQLRECRLLSAEEARRLAEEQWPGGPPLDVHQIYLLEGCRDVHSHVAGLRSRLDVVYRADGLACCEPATVEDGGDVAGLPGVKRQLVTFPPYWKGPVWVEVDCGEDCRGLVGLNWGPWRTKVVMEGHHATLAFRQATESPQLEVYTKRRWLVSAGIGRRDGSFVIDRWAPADEGSARSIYQYMRGAYLAGVGGTRRGLARFVRQLEEPRQGLH